MDVWPMAAMTVMIAVVLLLVGSGDLSGVGEVGRWCNIGCFW